MTGCPSNLGLKLTVAAKMVRLGITQTDGTLHTLPVISVTVKKQHPSVLL